MELWVVLSGIFVVLFCLKKEHSKKAAFLLYKVFIRDLVKFYHFAQRAFEICDIRWSLSSFRRPK